MLSNWDMLQADVPTRERVEAAASFLVSDGLADVDDSWGMRLTDRGRDLLSSVTGVRGMRSMPGAVGTLLADHAPNVTSLTLPPHLFDAGLERYRVGTRRRADSADAAWLRERKSRIPRNGSRRAGRRARLAGKRRARLDPVLDLGTPALGWSALVMVLGAVGVSRHGRLLSGETVALVVTIVGAVAALVALVIAVRVIARPLVSSFPAVPVYAALAAAVVSPVVLSVREPRVATTDMPGPLLACALVLAFSAVALVARRRRLRTSDATDTAATAQAVAAVEEAAEEPRTAPAADVSGAPRS
ncbi:hypothetical protein SAMN04487847_0113 [Microbacterium sp. cf332]|nr:hypothetical protein SAMN04487847_0113 [Microbacterium sp. cf332]